MADDYSDLLTGEPQRPSRADILYNSLIPDYLKYQEPSPMPPLGTPPGKIGPPSGNPSLGDMVAKGLPDIASFLAPEAKLGAAAASKFLPAALFLSNPKYVGTSGLGKGLIEHNIVNDDLKHVGKVTVESPHKNDLYVRDMESWIGSPKNPNSASNSFGTVETRNILKALSKEYPDANTISGFRTGGARPKPAEAKFKIPDQWRNEEANRLMNDPKFQEISRNNFIKSNPSAILHRSDNTVQMRPQKYLDLAMPFGVSGGPKTDWNKVDKLAKMEKWDTNPMLSVKQNNEGNYQVGIHDGRHRALAALQRGDPSLNVDIVRGQKFKRENPNVSDEDMAKSVSQTGVLPENYGLGK